MSDNQTLADVMKSDSKVMSLAIEDCEITETRDWVGFFNTITSFLKGCNMQLVGIDKDTYGKVAKQQAILLKATPAVTDESPAT